jgi:hypothetical protein
MKKSMTRSKDSGIVLFYLAALLFVLLAFAGLAVDLGRAYVVKAHLSKAVDGAALAAARVIGNGQGVATTEATKIFNTNFPIGFLGVNSVTNPPTLNFQVAADGSNQITVSSTAVMPTTFMKVIGQNQVNVFSSGQATRRLVDISFVIDKSGSLGSVWSQVKSAAQQFVSYFDENVDRMSVVMFSANTIVTDNIRPTARGFDKATVISHIGSFNSGGNTGSAEGMYQGWDQLRSVTTGNQSSLRIIVFFTDGAPNTISAQFNVENGAPGVYINKTGALFTGDYPNVGVGSSTSTPNVAGLYQIYGTLAAQTETFVPPTNNTYTSGASSFPYQTPLNSKIPWIPLMSTHPQHISPGIASSFVLYDPALAGQRPLIGQTVNGYPDHVRNANCAARNLLETIANATRGDTTGDFKIRIYTLGLGALLKLPMGTALETGESILQRVANDKTSPNFNSSQLEGKYYYAADPAQLRAAFEAVRNQILRLSQ